MKANILGVAYDVLLDVDEKDDTKLKRADGYMDHTTKKIVVAKMEQDDDSLGDLNVYAKKVLRHEIIHAFLAESGLRENSGSVKSWAQSEEIVDWIAIPLEYLARSIKDLSSADTAYFVQGWSEFRGCKIEHTCAVEYGIDRIEE